MTYDLINKHLSLSTAILKGHMAQHRKGLQSTSSDQKMVLDARKSVSNMDPAKQICSAGEDEIYCFAVIVNRNKNTIYSNPTGHFPVQSYKGMQYIFVEYVYKINTILLRPMMSQHYPGMVETFTSVYDKLTAAGNQPTHHVLNHKYACPIQHFLD